MAWSCRSHSPPWSQIGQSSGWLMSRNSITPWRAFFAISLSVRITMPSVAGMAQDAMGLGDFSCSTRHMRQLPAMARRWWKQKCATSKPACWQAWSTVTPGATSTAFPLMVSFGMALLRRHFAVFPDAPLHLREEMADQPLDRPGGGIAQRADGVALNLVGNLQQRVDLARLGLALDHALHHPPHPPRAFAAGRALAAAFVLVEFGQPRDRLDDVGALIHHDHGCGAEAGFDFIERVEIHQHGVADRFRDHRHGGAARDHGQQIVPAAAHAAGVFFD